MTGIYKITNKIHTNKIYVGKSINISKRWKQHINQLNSQTHHNHKLQYDWLLNNGIDGFDFEVLEECTKDILDKRERYWIKQIGFYNSRESKTEKYIIQNQIIKQDYIFWEHKGIKFNDLINEGLLYIDNIDSFNFWNSFRDILNKEKNIQIKTI